MLLIFVLCSECPVVLSYTSLIPTKAVMTRVDSIDGIATGPSYLTWKLNTHKIPPCPLKKTWVIMIRPWIFPQVLPRDFSQIMSCSKFRFAQEEHQNLPGDPPILVDCPMGTMFTSLGKIQLPGSTSKRAAPQKNVI